MGEEGETFQGFHNYSSDSHLSGGAEEVVATAVHDAVLAEHAPADELPPAEGKWL